MFLAEQRIGAGTPKRALDADALQKKLNLRYPDIAWFHVYVYNVTLVVEVTHGVPMPKPADTAPADVVATRDGVVQSVFTHAGTPKVKAGDIVRKGQVLIAGVERSADEQLNAVRARGVVMARCWQSHAVEMPMEEIESSETGRADTVTRLATPWLVYPQQLEAPAFLAYNTYITQLPVVGSFFPVTLQTVERREVAMEYRLRDGDIVRKEAAEAAHSALAVSLRGYEIIDKWTDYCMIDGGVLRATATAEWRMDIGGYAPP